MRLSMHARGVLTGLAAVGVAVAGLPGSAVAADDDPAPLVGMNAAGVVKGSYIVVLNDDASETEVRKAGERAGDAGGTVTHRYSNALKGYSATLTAAELQEVRQDPAVEHVEPVTVVRRFDSPVRTLDTEASPPWGLDRVDQRALPLSTSYWWNNANTGTGVRAYVIDSGINATHDDFGGRVAAGYDATTEGDGPVDCDGHGTHVAGTIGGTRFGIAKQVTIVPVQVFRCDGLDTDNSALLAGIDWVVKNHTGGPAVANMSLGGPAAGNGAIDKAVGKMISDQITVVVASGNFYPSDPEPAWRSPIACNYTPAKVTAAITVSATRKSESRDTAYATYGKCVDLFAPGSDITSDWYTSNTATDVLSGTSMATPHVTGIAAAYLTTHTDATPAEVQAAIIGASTKNAVKNAGTGSPNRLAYSRIYPPKKASATDRLKAGEGLRYGESISSPNKLYRLQQQTDGNLVLTKVGGRVLWASGKKTSWVAMQDSGNLLGSLYTASVWSSSTAGNGACELRITNDGNVMVRRVSDDKPLWSTKTKQKLTPPAEVPTGGDRLTAGQVIYRNGAHLVSPNGRYRAYVRGPNGVFVVRDMTAGKDIWATKALSDDWLQLQADGNLVLLSSNGSALWSTGTGGKGDSRLVMQNDGNLVLYDNSPNKATWSSKSGKVG